MSGQSSTGAGAISRAGPDIRVGARVGKIRAQRRSRGMHERTKFRAFETSIAAHPAAHVDPPRSHLGNRTRNVLCTQTAGEENRNVDRTPDLRR